MNTNWLRLLAIPALAGGIMIAAGQEPGGDQAAPPQSQQQGKRHPGARIAQYLNLTPEQQQAATAQMQQARAAGRPIRQQLTQVRQQMFQAIRANDAAGIQQLSSQEANLKGQLIALRSGAFGRIYSSLTPEQKAKADQLPAHFRQMKQHRMEMRQNGSNG
jgi:Spy/CpxP family protein refolding chaperone